MRFDDYHRTIIGYHGTRLSVALEIVQGRRRFDPSRNPDDWLGHGVYFWEYAPQQAHSWAERLRREKKWNEPIAVLGSMIRLGLCFDLLDPYNVRYLRGIYDSFCAAETAAGRELPKNVRHHRRLDCAVFRYAYALIEAESNSRAVDTTRAVYVPTDTKRRVWPGSWISEGAHVQVCVRNVSCILGNLASPPLRSRRIR